MADAAKKTLDDFWVPWVDIPPEDVDKFRQVLETAAGEAEMQVFLEENPQFLCQHLPAARGYFVIPTKRLGSEHVTDFLLGEDTPHQRTWHAVEVGTPAGATLYASGRSCCGTDTCNAPDRRLAELAVTKPRLRVTCSRVVRSSSLRALAI